MRRLNLLQQFSAVSLLLFIAIGSLLGWGLTHYFEQQAIDQQKYAVSPLVQPVVGDHITAEILTNGAHGDQYEAIEGALASLGGSGLARVKIWNERGMIIYSDEKELVGLRFPIEAELAESLEGLTAARISPLNREENIEEQGYGELLEVYTPLRLPGESEISGVFEGYYDIDDLRDRINLTNEYLWASIGTGFMFLYVSLFTIVRNASQRIARQSRENALLLADTERKAARLQLVNELARSINQSSLNLDKVFDTALRGIDRIVPHRGARITLVDERTGQPIGAIESGRLSGGLLPAGKTNVRQEKKLLAEADTFLCSDTRASDSSALAALAAKGILSVLLVAITLGERRLGVVRLVSDRPYAFDEEDASILKGVADQLAVAIENTRLIKETAETTALRETNRLKDEFVSMVSHELRTPLASIKGYSRTLLAADGNWDEQTRHEFLSIIADESDKLTELVENLLEMSRIEGGRLPIMPEPIIMRRFCRDVVERVGNHYPEMKFNCDLDDNLPMVEADPRRVEQVLLNLLQNAAKYSGAGAVDVCGSYSGGREVLVSVRDNGVGIAPEHLPNLFDKFYRAAGDNADNESGTGLGLAIAKALVEAQGGRIWVESKLNEGTTFYFTLPVLMVEDEEGHIRGRGLPHTPVPAGR